MNTLEYIDAYFMQTLKQDERRMFEKRCEEDESFVAEVAFYLTARQSLKDELLNQKKTQWRNTNVEEKLPSISPVKQAATQSERADEDVWYIPSSLKKSFANRWVGYAAAACLVLALSVYLFETNTSIRKYASNYVAGNYNTLSQTMDASHDSLQLGIAAYNNKDFNKALQLFTGVEKNDPQNSEAKQFAGLAYLRSSDYDNAVNQFDNLASMKNLFSNPGNFLKAISLLERNKPEDKAEAKKLLQKVVDEKEEGHEKAAEWLKRF